MSYRNFLFFLIDELAGFLSEVVVYKTFYVRDSLMQILLSLLCESWELCHFGSKCKYPGHSDYQSTVSKIVGKFRGVSQVTDNCFLYRKIQWANCDGKVNQQFWNTLTTEKDLEILRNGITPALLAWYPDYQNPQMRRNLIWFTSPPNRPGGGRFMEWAARYPDLPLLIVTFGDISNLK